MMFGIIDLTKGYYQAPLSEASKHYTAFITACALFEWNRVPMGLMGAPSYFQKMMTTHVLAGLLHNSCEVYMDDIIIFGKTEKEYLHNLEEVLKRLRRFKLTGNPDKTKLGLRQIEYVGHILDESGISFKRERLQKIIDFPQPNTAGELKTFLGVANYVRDNVPNMSTLVQPLTALLPEGYTKKKKSYRVHWDDATSAALDRLKLAINNCQKLFFIKDDFVKYPVHLFTDASEHGIGAYLCQLVDGKWQVISFMSKSLTPTQSRWSTIEREAFAIYEAFKKFEYLIRDIHFVLHTDHENLVHIRDTGSSKVIGWKLLIQEFDFEVQYIKGEKNIVADMLSRNTLAEMGVDEVESEPKTDLAKLMRPDVSSKLPGHLFMFDGIIPQREYEILRGVHNSVVGHNGVDNTMIKLKSANHEWKHMREMVDKFIKDCDCCQKATSRKYKNDVALYTTVGMNLMQVLNIDSIGPLEPDADGHTHMIVIIDKFSRWLELYPTKGADAISAARALLNHYGRFGIPQKIVSDRGKEYCNKLIATFQQLVGTTHEFTIANSHEENSVVERANLEVRRYLNDICYDKRLRNNQWSENIPLIMRIFNSLPKELTKCSPAHMLYAGSLSLNQKLFRDEVVNYENILEDYNKSWKQWMDERKLAQQSCIELAQKNTQEHIDKHKLEDTGRRSEYPVGSYVLKAWPPSTYGRGKPSKQDMNLRGPYMVLSSEGSTYTLQDLITKKPMEPCNISLLRPFSYDKSRVNPIDIRLKDTSDMWIVEEVQKHSGDFKRKNSLTFTVKWVGFPDTTQEKWNNMLHNIKLHEYLTSIGKAMYIPK